MLVIVVIWKMPTDPKLMRSTNVEYALFQQTLLGGHDGRIHSFLMLPPGPKSRYELRGQPMIVAWHVDEIADHLRSGGKARSLV